MIIYILIFLLGLSTGSFLNAVIWRLETGESIVAELRGTSRGTTRKINSSETKFLFKKLSFFWGAKMARSYCPQCKTTLRWHDLIPVVSFFILRGKCRYCNKKISIQYPLVEISTGFIFLLISNIQYPISNHLDIGYFDFYWILGFGYWLFIVSSMIVIFVYDLKHYIIPDKILFPAIGVSIMYHVLSIIYGQNYTLYIILHTLYNYAGSALAAFGFFLALVLFSRGKWMGLGDVKLAVLMGLILGWPNILVALFLAFMSGAVVGLILISISGISGHRKTEGLAMTKNYSLKSQIPFGPFLIIGTFTALFWGQKIIEWYWGMLF